MTMDSVHPAPLRPHGQLENGQQGDPASGPATQPILSKRTSSLMATQDVSSAASAASTGPSSIMADGKAYRSMLDIGDTPKTASLNQTSSDDDKAEDSSKTSDSEGMVSHSTVVVGFLVPTNCDDDQVNDLSCQPPETFALIAGDCSR